MIVNFLLGWQGAVARRAPWSNLATRAAALIDAGAVAIARHRTATPAREHPGTLPDDDSARRRMIELAKAYRDSTASFFAPVSLTDEDRSDFHIAPAPRLAASLSASSTIRDISFPSRYRPWLASYRDEHQRYLANLTVHARWWSQSPPAPRPVVILLHGWQQGPYWMIDRMMARAQWQEAGFDVVAMQLPMHGERAPSDGDGGHDLPSGALFPSPHLARTNESVGQAISDLRMLAAHLRRLGAPSIGVVGMSLGGYIASLWASLDESLAFAVAWVPTTSIAESMAQHGAPTTAWQRAQKAGISTDLLGDVFSVHSPLRRLPLLPADTLWVVGGLGDRVTPPSHAEALAKHWQGAHVRWFAGGHLAQVGGGAVIAEIIDFVARATTKPIVSRAQPNDKGAP